MDKQQAIKYLYQDWLDYKNYYFKIGFEMKESFIEYLENKLIEIQDNIKQTKKEYPCDSNDAFCHECGNDTHDASYDEQMQEVFILQEIERYK